MSSTNVVIHVGVSKTGTSTLQEEVFPKHEGIDFRFWPDTHDIPLFYDCLYCDVIYDDDDRFEKCAEAIREAHKDAVSPILYSREHLTHQRYDKGTMARRLRRLFGEAKIIVTIRNQMDWIESSHVWNQQLLRRPWQGGLPPLLPSYLEGNWKERWRSRISSGDFGAIVRRYAELFGRENVCVLPFEEMVRYPDLFAERLFGFIGVDPDRGRSLMEGSHRNPRLSRREYEFWRWRAWLVPLSVQRVFMTLGMPTPLVRFLQSGSRFKAQIPDVWQARLSEHFAPGNRYIMDTFGVPLDQYGYPV